MTPPPLPARPGLFAELRRRNVIRMAGLYLVGAWLIVQVAETVLPAFDVPGWVLRATIILLAIGFVPALVFSWVFELTPDGLKRESEIDRSQSSVDQTARKLDIAVIVLLLGIGGLLLWGPRDAPSGPTPVADGTGAAPANAADGADDGAEGVDPASNAPHAKSIAVLPFADFSPGGDQAWFADGLAEEILNALARTPDLQVSARTSSFRYKGSVLAVPQIAAELGVAHVLEGSVRSTPQRVRVTAQLIRAADGFHLWSQNYDRDPADMIEIQEDLARQIATAMHTSMDPEALADMAAVGTRSVEAYQAYVRGIAHKGSLEPADYTRAYDMFEQARRLDPTFSAAHAHAAEFWLDQLYFSGTRSGLTEASHAQASAHYAERIDLAIAHAANPVDRLERRASKATRELRLRDAIELHRAVLAERPNDVAARIALLTLAMYASDRPLMIAELEALWPQAQLRLDAAVTHANWSHRVLDSATAADQALLLARRWPDDRPVLYQAHRALLWDGRVGEAREVLRRMQSLDREHSRWQMLPPARQACAEGRRAEVEATLATLPDTHLSQRWHLLMLLGRGQEAADLLQPLERDGNTYALAGFLAYTEFDPTPFPSLMAVLEREQVDRPPPVPLPYVCPPAESDA
jgi:TolB-like protein